MNAEEAIEWITDDAAEMTAMLRKAAPDQPVPACPPWTAADLSGHVARGFAAWYCYNLSTPAASWAPAGLMERFGQLGDEHEANVDAFEAGVAEFVRLCSETDLSAPSWSFGGTAPAGWWIRRAGTELTVHLTDAAGMHGRRSSTPPLRHSEAVDEVLAELFPRLPSLRASMNMLLDRDLPTPAPPEAPAALVAEDTGQSWTLTRSAEGTTSTVRGVTGSAGAVGRGSSADLLAWIHGRPMSGPLSVEGDASLLDEWNLLQRSEF